MKTFAAGGVTVTAGHFPAHYSGFKWIPYWGGPALPQIADDLDARAQGLTIAEAEKIVAGRPYGSKAHLQTRKIVSPDSYQIISKLVIARQPSKDAGKNAELQQKK